MFREYKKSITVAVVVLVIVILGITVVSCMYTQSLFQSMKSESDYELMDKAKSTVGGLQTQIKNDTEMLENISMLITDINDTDDVMDYLKQIVIKNQFNLIVIIDADGNGKSTDGRTYNCSSTEYFKSGIAGDSGVTEPLYSFDGKTINAYYVPIMNGDEIVGVLAASYDTQAFQNSLDLTVEDGLGMGYIANNKGTLIACSENTVIDPARNSMFDLTDSTATEDSLAMQRVIDNMIVGASGMTEFKSSEGKFYMNYLPIEVNNWYLVNVIPEKAVTDRIYSMLSYTIGVIGMILTIFIIVFIYVVHTLKKSSKELYHFAFTDPVTSYGNANAFRRDVKEILSKKSARKFAILHFDIDKFKYINDMYGFNEGDRTLKTIAEILECETIKDTETHARLSNDLFAVLLSYIEREGLVARIDKILNSIETMDETGKSRFGVSINAGVYEITDPTVDISLMIDRANIAHKSVKSNKLSKFAFYQDNMRDDILREKEIENEMYDALADGQFEVYYQPKYFVNTSTLGGAEALIRWNHPQKGLIPPNHFIPLFEKNGFVVQIDLFVFKQVCIHISEWLDKGYKVVPISVNLSRVHFYEQDFMKEFKEIIEKYKIPSQYIEFEVTESTALENTEKLLAVLNEIHSIGCSVSMDDFGSGYSSLNMLKQIPVDVLKIDRDFFNDSTDNMRGREIVSSVVKLAKNLGIDVVAEGIEDKEQLAFLQDINCDLAQGYYFAKPLRKPEFEKRLCKGAE
jgi:diguanylate cyclase (GGDEF)-like protein